MKKLSYLLMTLSVLLFVSCTQKKESELKLDYEKYTLSNGLDVILHVDKSDPIVALAVQYHVGSNREEPGRTGFAHLFEHMMFQQSENVGEDQFFKLIQNAGGTLNGGTGNDATTYFEVVPKNALEMILWMESDRMGYMINTVTPKSFAIQQNVVQNEKRQRVDNRPYGHTGVVVAHNFYPEGHPYSWTVIGEMEDLTNATIEDVKEFHSKWYVPNNATLVLAGDFEIEQTKKLVEQYFGEIPRGAEIMDPEPMPVTLTETKKLYHEDNFAKAPQYRMMWPTVEEYNDDAYALSYLGELFSRGKKAPLYKVLEKEKKLSSSQYAYNGSQEIAGTFNIGVTANDGVSLQEVEDAIFEAFGLFEEEKFTEADVDRIKASLETDFYNGISSVLYKAFQLANYNEYAGDPSYYKTDIEKLKAVTGDDIWRVYNKYIKDKPFFATSFVPRGQLDLIADGSVWAGIEEEDVMNATEVNIDEIEDVEIKKTPTSFDRSVQPADGPDPLLNLPEIWTGELANGMDVYGIENNELPLVQFSIVLKGGHYLDKIEKSGTASLLATMLESGTVNKTSQELEEAIEKLGANINVYASNGSISISGNALARNYDEVLALAKEMLLEPRWDEEEFDLAKTAVLNRLKRQKADPSAIARNTFNELVYGDDHIFSSGTSGTVESVESITMDDLKNYYNANFSPSVSAFHVAGDIAKNKVMESLRDLSDTWTAKAVVFPAYDIPEAPETSRVYFADVPGAKQSVIYIGAPSMARTDDDFYPATVMNHKLGGSFNSHVNLVLREEKGYTYGARTYFSGSYVPGYFLASSSVRSSATEESVEIFKTLMEDYREGITEEEMEFTKNALVKSNAREFETLRSLLYMLQNISMYDLPFDYVKGEEETVLNMDLEHHKMLAQKYIDPSKMYYVIAGDAATQMEPLAQLGYGEPILVENE
ncbi:MAG: pitrilysin family protein [Bacteroidales bacterium]|jgi:zinc protease|nr:pitrilysin family protein [Bacteroidales bacterium]